MCACARVCNTKEERKSGYTETLSVHESAGDEESLCEDQFVFLRNDEDFAGNKQLSEVTVEYLEIKKKRRGYFCKICIFLQSS